MCEYTRKTPTAAQVDGSVAIQPSSRQELAPQIYGISKYRDMYLYSEEIDLIVHIQRRYKDTVVVSIVLSILGTWAALYGLYYKIYER